MDTLHNLFYGFSIAIQPDNILLCFLGVLVGTLVGVLPGIGPIGAISILLPATFKLPATSAIIMLAGIFYGAMYGGSITSILVNIPGEAASVITCLDGYQMAKQGKAGSALGIAAFGSFIAGTLGIMGLMLFAAPLARFGLLFSSPEYFAVTLLGLTLIMYLSSGSMIKAIMMAAFGQILSCVGLDHIYATPRMTFNMMELLDGMDLIPVAMGLFGISEVLVNIEESHTPEILKTKIKNLLPTASEWARSKGAILRGSVIGFFVSILPGGGTVISTFISYAVEKNISKEPETFGKGAIQGVAGPEAANNAATSGCFVPLLTLGIPTNAIMALMFGALLIHGVRPGPLFLEKHADVFWGVIGSMYIGNGMLLILNLPLIPLWVQVLKVPYGFLFPMILLFCIIGSFSLNHRIFDVVVMFIFGIVGYLFRKFEYEGAPLILAFVLGPIMERSLRQTLLFSKGSFSIFFERPISAVCITIALFLFAMAFVSYLWKERKKRRSRSPRGCPA